MQHGAYLGRAVLERKIYLEQPLPIKAIGIRQKARRGGKNY
jgi:hypothetical protein